jgi:hypothetical protein
VRAARGRDSVAAVSAVGEAPVGSATAATLGGSELRSFAAGDGAGTVTTAGGRGVAGAGDSAIAAYMAVLADADGDAVTRADAATPLRAGGASRLIDIDAIAPTIDSVQTIATTRRER